MELQGDRQEIAIRLLQNGKYVWTIAVNTQLGNPEAVSKLKQLDGTLRDAFPNHVKESSVKFHDMPDE